MTPALDPQTLTRLVVWGGLLIGLVLGAVGQSTRFCVRGAIADWMIFRGPARFVSWMLAVVVGAVAVQAMVSTGTIDATRTVGWSDRFLWLSCLLGGFVFGVGMMLAGGCPQRSLVKAGAGNLRSLVTLIVLAVASAMTLRGLFSGLRVSLLDRVNTQLTGPQDLGTLLSSLMPLSATTWRWTVVLLASVAVVGYAWRVRRSLETGHWVGGIAVGLLVAAAFWLTGHVGFVVEHPETLEAAWLGTQSHRPEGLSFSAPLAHTLDLLTLWSDRSTVASFGVMVVAGTLVGSFVSAKLRGEFKLESFQSPRDVVSHLSGGMLMGFGGVTALGCSLGNGVTGLALLSGGSLLAVLGMSIGACCVTARQLRLAESAA